MKRAPSRVFNAARTVRGRSAIVAGTVVAAALAVGSILVLSSFRDRLEANRDQTLQRQATDRAQLIDQGTDPEALTSALRSESMVWIGTIDGEVLAQGGSVRPIENPVPAVLDTTASVRLRVEERHSNEVEIELMDLSISSARTADGALVVLVGTETGEVDHSVQELRQLFLAAIPILVAIVAASAWFTTGLALRPVERIRGRTAAVTGANLSQRVPVPGGRDEVHALAITMNDMLDRFEAHERALRQFTADASHELKSPVANLRALVDTTQLTDPQWFELRDRLTGETDRLAGLVDNLLYMASHLDDSPRQTTAKNLVHIDDLLFDEAEILRVTARVAVDLGAVEPASIHANRSDLRRLIRNLVDNAAQHAESLVTLSCEQTETNVVFRIGDDGPGIPDDKRDYVLERFTRLDESRTRNAGGSGLGLAIAKQVADQYRASLEIGRSCQGGAIVAFPRLDVDVSGG